ncbi:MAG TPA: hypothetical protein VM489_13495 [Burkholderiales bacterium]|nr:hypothetical protein [Burkholderiales bacterium]
MNRAKLTRVLSVVPERCERALSGTRFRPDAGACVHPERLTHLTRFLHWLGPLEALTRDDQRVLGLANGSGRPTHPADEDDPEPESELAVGSGLLTSG